MRDDQVADRVVGRHAAGVADDVRVAGLQAEQVLDVEPRVHARDDRDPPRRREREIGLVERLGIGAGVLE